MKRDQFLRELRKAAKALGLELEVFEDRGKGSHYRIRLGERMSTVKSGDLSPTYVRLVRKQLGID
ncbi:type II toxin-antitoxin system HicA family toxin [Aquibium carbonis]|uniref:Type II toxin-antitoxin system HicA family toxin n=1 Tax=Aquibium carbonis TaxID=2495581 RepID=A0A3R9Y6Y3_9HYPH|nr:type II toxin-antitoxin system HicA family toxin [Aquibium carbonis]RST84559.1 type II toxin-antitoxin system HicA family toxin [Aquibium carbonis]